ncbi:MAG: phage head closure protein [Ruminococcus sp.]|nr:phage head closure protein [Ruminococcus sp.]
MAYNKKIEIQQLAEGFDNIGNQVRQWQTIFNPWAEIRTNTGKEYFAAAQVNSEDEYVFKIRYSRNIAEKLSSELRIVYKNQIFDIKNIQDTNDLHREFVIRAVQLNKAGE